MGKSSKSKNLCQPWTVPAVNQQPLGPLGRQHPQGLEDLERQGPAPRGMLQHLQVHPCGLPTEALRPEVHGTAEAFEGPTRPGSFQNRHQQMLKTLGMVCEILVFPNYLRLNYVRLLVS